MRDGTHSLPADDRLVIELRDESLLDGLAELRWRFNELVECGPSMVVVDVSRVSRLSSATIAALLWVRRRCQARRIDMTLRNPSKHSVETLRSIGLLRAIDIEQPTGRRRGRAKSIRGGFCA